eukprot:1369206-Alexandrium_andersonii.AAC.1
MRKSVRAGGGRFIGWRSATPGQAARRIALEARQPTYTRTKDWASPRNAIRYTTNQKKHIAARRVQTATRRTWARAAQLGPANSG